MSASESSTERSLQPRRNPVDTTRSVDDSEGALWPYQLAMLVITACWGANFAVTSWSLDALGGDATDGTLFVAARFLVGAGALVPFLASANSMAVCIAGAQVGALCAAGYAAQSVSLALGTEAGTAAFICSLQSVVVALGASTKTGGVARQTWLAVALRSPVSAASNCCTTRRASLSLPMSAPTPPRPRPPLRAAARAACWAT